MIETALLALDDADLDALLTRSHQTSLYVLPEWLDAFPPAAIYGAYRDERLTAALFVEKGLAPPPFVQYRGLLLTRKEQPSEAAALLQEAEKMGRVSVWNAPSLVDIGPFSWRHPEAVWKPDVRYTYIIDRATARPLRDYRAVEYWEEMPKDLPPLELDLQAPFLTILNFPSTLTFRSATATLVCGVDRQKRGFYIAGWGVELDALTWAIAQRFESFDMGGANSPKMRSRKRNFGGRLRTCYRLAI